MGRGSYSVCYAEGGDFPPLDEKKEVEFTDAGLAHLKDMKNLKMLIMARTKVTAPAIDELKKVLPGCEMIFVPGREK